MGWSIERHASMDEDEGEKQGETREAMNVPAEEGTRSKKEGSSNGAVGLKGGGEEERLKEPLNRGRGSRASDSLLPPLNISSYSNTSS